MKFKTQLLKYTSHISNAHHILAKDCHIGQHSLRVLDNWIFWVDNKLVI